MRTPTYARAMAIIGALFFIFGFVSWLNAALIPYFKLTCQLNDRQSMLVAFAFYISYFVMAFPSSAILRRTGFKNGMLLGLWVMALGALVFIPAAQLRAYGLFLAGLFIQATGLTILQTASNPYVTILGPLDSAAQRISVMGICNKIAGAIAPLVLLRLITKSDDEIDQLTQKLPGLSDADKALVLNDLSGRLVLPYAVMAGVLFGLGLLIRYSGLPDVKEQDDETGQSEGRESLWSYPHMWLGAVAITAAVSVEVLSVDSIIGYAQQAGFTFKDAKYFATYTLLFMIVSYGIGTMVIPKFISQRRMLTWASLLGLVLSLVAVTIGGHLSVWAIALLGLANAMFWPAIWPLALDGLGRFTKSASALLIMGIIGGAVIPLIYGTISDQTGPQSAYWVLVPCYAFLMYFATSGYKAGKSQ